VQPIIDSSIVAANKSDKGVADAQSAYNASGALALTDAGGVVIANNASAMTLTVPPQSSVVWLARTRIDIFQQGAGQVTVAAGAGVTIFSAGGALKLAAQYAGATLYRISQDTWFLVGNIST
jgi:hypothetical protein